MDVTTAMSFLNSLGLLISDSRYQNLIAKNIIDMAKDEPAEPLWGDASGLMAFMSLFLVQDCAVLAFEGLQLFQGQDDTFVDSATDECSEGYFERLKMVRNNMHLYNKYGAYGKKATAIIQSQLQEFDMLTKDALYSLRSDFLLIYRITDDKKILLGCNYSVFHNHDTQKIKWTGIEYHDFAKDTSSIVSQFSRLDTVALPNIETAIFDKKEPWQIELFDKKSDEFFDATGLTNTTAFRLILILSSASYLCALIDMCVDLDKVMVSTIDLCYFNKLVAIKYDEAFDSLSNLLQFVGSADRAVIEEALAQVGLSLNSLKGADKARLLRNMIHYGDIQIQIHNNDAGKPEIQLPRIYSSETGIPTWKGYQDNLKIMLHEVSLLTDALRLILDENM